MKNMIIDDEVLKNNALPNLDIAHSKMNEAIQLCNSLDIPVDFNDSQLLYCLMEDLNQLNKDIIKIKSWINNSIISYNRIENDISSYLKSIYPNELKIRESIISPK